MRYLFIGSFIVLFSGCATISSIERNAKSIESYDGINREEAKIIAKNQIIQTNFKDDYRVIGPHVYDAVELTEKIKTKETFSNNKALYDNGRLRYADSWYVVFRPKLLSLFSLYYLVIIDKNSGKVQYTCEENGLASLFEVAFSNLWDDLSQLQPAAIAVTYYTEKGYWPTKPEELQEYFEEKIAPQDTKEKGSEISFKDFQFKQTQEGYFLIEKENRERVTSDLLYEIRPSGDNKFIIYYKKAKVQESYILETIDGKIKVYLNIQGKEAEFLGNLFNPRNWDKIIEKDR